MPLVALQRGGRHLELRLLEGRLVGVGVGVGVGHELVAAGGGGGGTGHLNLIFVLSLFQ